MATTGGDGTICATERRADRDEMRVPVEPDIDGFGGVPELIEAGIEVEVHANRNRFNERRIGEQS